MKTIINLLEKKGAGLALLPEDVAELDEATIQAIERNDEHYIEQLLDVKKDIVCIILPAEDDEDEGEEEDKPEEGSRVASHTVTKYA